MSGGRVAAPLVMIAELTHRCPLRCAYCSNPRALEPPDAELSTDQWVDAFEQAGALGVLQAHLSGGEPLLRRDLEDIATAAADNGIYTTLVTSGIDRPNAAPGRLERLVGAGIRAIQVSFQDTSARAAEAVAGQDALATKVAFCREVRALGASLTTNFVLHRFNLERLPQLIQLSLELGADRLELAHVQYHGWAAANRAALIPTDEQMRQAQRVVAQARLRHAGSIELVHVMPDHFFGRAKACMTGWGQRALVVSPDGSLLPCHHAKSLPLAHDRLQECSLADAWYHGEAFNAFRGEQWMDLPCRSCPERARDSGGCRCQAFGLTGSVTATDPACERSPRHDLVVKLRRPPSRTASNLPEPGDLELRRYTRSGRSG